MKITLCKTDKIPSSIYVSFERPEATVYYSGSEDQAKAKAMQYLQEREYDVSSVTFATA